MDELVGVLPAAGRGSRLGPIPCSKEIMPLGFQPADGSSQWRPMTALESHLHALRSAGVDRSVVVVSESKADIVRYVGDGSRYGVALAYVYQQELRGMPYALDLARPWIGAATTVFAMPDTLVTPDHTLARLVEHHRAHDGDLTLGLFRTTTPHKFGMVELDAAGQVVHLVDKPAHSDLDLMWGLAVWSPRFTQVLHTFVRRATRNKGEAVLSDVFEVALHQGLRVQGVLLSDAQYHDIGTPEDFQAVVLERAVQQATFSKTASNSHIPESSSAKGTSNQA